MVVDGAGIIAADGEAHDTVGAVITAAGKATMVTGVLDGQDIMAAGDGTVRDGRRPTLSTRPLMRGWRHMPSMKPPKTRMGMRDMAIPSIIPRRHILIHRIIPSHAMALQ